MSTKAENLGILFDPSLTFPTHITATCKSANYESYCLRRIKCYLSKDTLKTAVYALILSKLDYCNSLLVGLPNAEIMKFQHIINSATHLVSGSKKIEHMMPVLIGLHWLPVKQHVLLKLLCLTYNALHQLAPEYIIDLLKSYSPARSVQSMGQDLLCIPYAHTKKYGQ